MSMNIVETARDAGSFTTLPAAVDAAGFGDVNVVSADIDAANGVIHVIDRALLPAAA